MNTGRLLRRLLWSFRIEVTGEVAIETLSRTGLSSLSARTKRERRRGVSAKRKPYVFFSNIFTKQAILF